MMSFRAFIVSLIIVATVGGAFLTVAAPQYAAAADGDSCNSGFLGFPAWYRGLTVNVNGDPCAIKSPNDVGGLSNFIWTIGLNVVEMALVAVAYISAILILYGGFLFITSQGYPENAANARSTMLRAIIGLIISMVAVGLVNFVAERLTEGKII